MSFIVIIPARFYSSRFPGKPLANINGKPMISRVIEQALASGADRVIVATDHIAVVQVVKSDKSLKEAEVCLTRSDHQSGTERIAEVAMRFKFKDNQIIVHLQGDEPLISPVMIAQVANVLQSIDIINMATMATPLYSLRDAYDYNVVKVVKTVNNHALYFSRSVIPWFCENYSDNCHELINTLLRHIGIYSYRVKFLNSYVKWIKSPLEQLEKLEQLRVLWHGQSIYVLVEKNGNHSISVDTLDDLFRVNAYFKK